MNYKEKYYEYLETSEWKLKRLDVIARCHNICERCGSSTVEAIHHLTYDRVFNEDLRDLQGLCKPCHAFIHGIIFTDPLESKIYFCKSCGKDMYKKNDLCEDCQIKDDNVHWIKLHENKMFKLDLKKMKYHAYPDWICLAVKHKKKIKASMFKIYEREIA
jgi:hypothetical protein